MSSLIESKSHTLRAFWSTSLPVLLGLVWLAACSSAQPAGQSDVEVTDSAGVALVGQVVDTSRALVLEEAWRVGSLDGDEATRFFTPRDAVIADGEVYVLDSGNHRVKVFAAADGRFLRSFGSEGSGPGEFQQLAVRMDVGNGIVAVMDAGRRLHSFRPSGEFIETMTLGQMLPAGSMAGEFRWAGEDGLITVARVFDPEAGRGIQGQPTALRTFSFDDGLGDETGLA